jgi:hypothetical protein
MPTTAIRIDTIRDLILDGYTISIHCRAYPARTASRPTSSLSRASTASIGAGSAGAGLIAAAAAARAMSANAPPRRAAQLVTGSRPRP